MGRTNRVVMFQVHIWDSPIPQDVSKALSKAANLCEARSAWVPHTVGDCVRLWYEFTTPQKLSIFLEMIPEDLKRFIHGFSEEDADRWLPPLTG